MVTRCCIMIYMCCVLKIPFILEQPMSSLLQYHPDFQRLCRSFTIYKVFIWIGSYGGSCPKGTFLYTNYRWVQELYLPLPKDREWDEDVSIKCIDSQGNHRVQGGPALKATQHYPALFGHSVAQLWERNRANIKRCVQHAAKLISAYNAGACVCTGR
ncbi:unnamed protein product [Durusdinium trenchii]|uniref:Uncharacterized protein n=1 Tax=Durusdinium trenchii TaxID=1381693 RepID=A0ABP0QFY0_9DINO